jgi:hypothetical protein
VPTQEARPPSFLNAHLSNCVESAGLNVLCWTTAYSRMWSADLRCGLTVVRTWNKQGRHAYKTLSWKKGLCFVITLRLHRFVPGRFTLAIASITRIPTLEITCNVTVNRLLDMEGAPYAACSKGNWPLLKSLIQDKKVGLRDATAYGSTMLHVGSRSL